ncbi:MULTISPECIES: iron chelate uptake ABC transporter family permease subunit [unclassified Clostridium]|uniref:iron chelate uptake ABC transporter family permease subunit n=1 Tax=unclassified Clostridium TaxID=2614128 RepID=UPI0025C73F6F|nr:iron chelate uptake ABC transporter family permease subunit [Clostridium sp.]MDY4252103.1 iron chelate uptake ABC transporter family permease subunit [Clostridium sp.]MDY6228355.1 iron chelate uptake ABC transporter family permease subunit [Clostridium sp.]
MKKNKRKIIILSLIAIISLVLFVVWGLTVKNYRFNLSIRIPKVLGILIAGTTISVASILFQTITNNRIITPSIIGLDSLYGLVQTLVVFIFGSTSIFMVNKTINFLLSASLMVTLAMILFKVVLKKGNNNIFFLLLVGTVIGTLFRSLSSFMQVIIDPNEFDALQAKLFASFSLVNTKILVVSVIILVIMGVILYRDFNKLDVMSLGREQAINLGVDYDKFSKKILFFVAILVSLSTALVGPITFLGIIVVNLTYEITKTYKHSVLLIVGTLISIIALVGGQFLVERVFNFTTTISIIINFIGGVYFINLLLKESKL